MPTINATIGDSAANSFETQAEANVYFDERLALPTAWVASGDQAIRSLIMATRVLDAMNMPHRVVRYDGPYKYYYTNRQWTGLPASTTQRLAWPRLGMFDANGNALDVTITNISVAVSAEVTTGAAHRKTTGDKVFISGSDSTPSIDGERTITVTSATTFTVAVTTTVAGTKGNVSWIPQALKDAESELAGQLLIADTTLDNAVLYGGITSVKAGSVAVSFKEAIQAHVLPDAVLNLMPPSWLTDELIEGALQAEFLIGPGPRSCR